MEITLSLSDTSSRVAKRRGHYNIPKLSCPAGVDPGILDCFVAVGFSQRRVTIRSHPQGGGEESFFAAREQSERLPHHAVQAGAWSPRLRELRHFP